MIALKAKVEELSASVGGKNFSSGKFVAALNYMRRGRAHDADGMLVDLLCDSTGDELFMQAMACDFGGFTTSNEARGPTGMPVRPF